MHSVLQVEFLVALPASLDMIHKRGRRLGWTRAKPLGYVANGRAVINVLGDGPAVSRYPNACDIMQKQRIDLWTQMKLVSHNEQAR